MGLSDRDYMRPTASRAAGRFVWSTTWKLVAANVALFLLWWLVGATFLGEWIYCFALLSPSSITHGFLWTLLSYGFFHFGVLHLAGNMLGLWFTGRFVENECGTRRLLALYLGGIFLGGILWLLPAFFSGHSSPPLLGASAGVFSVMTYALLRLFEQPVQMLIYFVLPVKIRAKWILAGFLFITLAGALLSEIPAATGWWTILSPPSGVAHTAHLGGMICGGLFFLRDQLQAGKITPLRQTIFVSNRPSTNVVDFSSATPNRQNRADKLDHILDKISRSGLASLSSEEKNFIEQESQRPPFS